MQIDWFTLVAQIVNFLILLWLLQRFLYGPILATMQAREDKLTAQFEAAARKEQAAEEERDALHAARAELETQREEYLADARAEAATRRRALLQEARAEAEQQLARWYDSIDREKATFLREIQVRLGEQVVTLVRRVLADLAGKELEEAIVYEFLQRLAAEEQAAPLPGAGSTPINQTAQPVVVRSTFALPENLAEQVRDALGTRLRESNVGQAGESVAPNIRFERDAELVCGIEVEIDDRRVAWNIRDYLGEIEQELTSVIRQSSDSVARTGRRAYIDEATDEILPG